MNVSTTSVEVTKMDRTELFLILCGAALLVWSIRGESHEQMAAHDHWSQAIAQPILPQLVVMVLLAWCMMLSLRLSRWMLTSSMRLLVRSVRHKH